MIFVERTPVDDDEVFAGLLHAHQFLRGDARRVTGVFDQFTGATITPRATTRAVYQTLMYYQTHRKALLEQAKSTTSAPSPDAVTVQSEESQDE